MIKINKNIAISLCCVALLTACGESSNDIQPNLPTVNSKTLTFSGKAIDGYIRGATLCLDINSNDSCDSNEPSVITDSEGSYTIEMAMSALMVEDNPTAYQSAPKILSPRYSSFHQVSSSSLNNSLNDR